jgi:hypothetical protein
VVGIVWLLAMRSSRAEAKRFAATAGLTARESATLEARLKVVNRELSLAREFLAAEARDLDAMGRIAAERLSTHAAQLQALIANNGAEVAAIATTCETALGNMNRLRDDLPVIANSARDIANLVGGVGRVAENQLERLAGGFAELSASTERSESYVMRLGQHVGETLGGFESQLACVEALIGERFAALHSEADAYRMRVSALEEQALGALHERATLAASQADGIAAALREAGDNAKAQFAETIKGLHEGLLEKLRQVEEIDRNTNTASSQRLIQLRDEARRIDDLLAARDQSFDEQMEQRQAAFETQAAQMSELLAQRIAALDDALNTQRETQLAEINKLVAQGESMAVSITVLTQAIGEAGETSDAAHAALTGSLDTLQQHLAEKREALAVTEAQMVELTDSSVRLLEILQSGARTCREDLSTAIGGANTALESVETRAAIVSGLMLQSSESGSALSDYLLRTQAEIDAAKSAMVALKLSLVEDTEGSLTRLQELRGSLARLSEEAGTLAAGTRDTLREMLGAIEIAITDAFATLDSRAHERMLALAGNLGSEVVEMLERTLRNETAATLSKLEQSAAHASGVGREAAIQLRDQLVKVNELTGNLEQRVTLARELAEEQINSDFARRMALITDSLNSAAIDISGALSSEVADTAWDAYLKGDRGIFTRRAVRLLDSGAVKKVAALYAADESFKTNVRRYIHYFEALLRQTLSTRDGHVLSVTILGSDMGKLYVALAQAIQRLRT